MQTIRRQLAGRVVSYEFYHSELVHGGYCPRAKGGDFQSTRITLVLRDVDRLVCKSLVSKDSPENNGALGNDEYRLLRETECSGSGTCAKTDGSISAALGRQKR